MKMLANDEPGSELDCPPPLAPAHSLEMLAVPLRHCTHHIDTVSCSRFQHWAPLKAFDGPEAGPGPKPSLEVR